MNTINSPHPPARRSLWQAGEGRKGWVIKNIIHFFESLNIILFTRISYTDFYLCKKFLIT